MPTTVSYSGSACASGVLVSFSGISLPLRETYKVEFSSISRMPESSYSINPTGFFITPADNNLKFSTVFSAVNGYTLYNSSSNIVKLSIYNNNNHEIYRDYAAVYCGNLSNDPIAPTATPSNTPANTPTPTVTSTPAVTNTPSSTPPISFSASFSSLNQNYNSCGQIIVTGIANGVINNNYTYSFTTDSSEELAIGNQTGVITITSNPTYVYTTLLLQKRCQNYSIKFGLSDGQNTVQSIGFLKCGNCPN